MSHTRHSMYLNPAHCCRSCSAPLVEVLSDYAGRIFGCPSCRTLGPQHGNTRPAEVTDLRSYSHRERRRRARERLRGRRGARRIPRGYEVTRPPAARWMVLPVEAFRGAEVRDLGDGWALGLWASPPAWPSLLMTKCIPAPPGQMPSVERVVIELGQVSGLVWGSYDKRAPWPLVQRAFERLYQERLSSVAPKFFAMLKADV